MSYDLMVFEKSRAPETQKEFILWYEQQTEWSEDHDYQTIEETSLTLQNWFMEMIRTFPPMNGEFAPDEAQFDEDENLEITASAMILFTQHLRGLWRSRLTNWPENWRKNIRLVFLMPAEMEILSCRMAQRWDEQKQ